MRVTAADLVTESDVEQKFLMPLLTEPVPSGLGFTPSDIVTKLNTRRLEIGKGGHRRTYFPDYLVVLAGLPVFVLEAKAPNESVEAALEEGRMYASEINALFPTGINPCVRVFACNGRVLLSAPADTAAPDIEMACVDCSPGHITFANLIDTCQRSQAQAVSDRMRKRFRKTLYARPVSRVGGTAFQNEELPQNTFGATIAGDYGHVFNPRSRQERALVVTRAYVPSTRRQRYVEPIDRLIRNTVAPVARGIAPLENTESPTEITAALRERRVLENQILLLVGSVGVGKSTFVDYLVEVALPADIREKTIWVRINLNEAPLAKELAYQWLARAMMADLRLQFSTTDFDDLNTLQRVFGPELNAFKKGPLALFAEDSPEYSRALAERLTALMSDPLGFVRAMARYLCGGPGRLLVVVLDNCDKRTRDEQLFMFEIAQWAQSEFHALVVLPIRDVTYDLHRSEPPLDTALKSLVFRIEPPLFSDVLQKRVRLALEEMQDRGRTSDNLSYELPNGIRVTYPASDQAFYLASILKSLYAHDRFVRQVMTGLAGRDVRRALELFLDFCTSGHIGEDEIFKIRHFEGRYELPLSSVARVLLRLNRRFYDGDKSHLKNIIQSSPDDALPDHFVRLAVLHWCDRRKDRKGPAGVNGFHRVADLVNDLAQLGHDALRVRQELQYLIREKCIVAEHLRNDVADEDLVKVTAAGAVHVQLMANPEYLAACAEDTYISDEALVGRIASRITEHGIRGHLSRSTAAKNASDLVDYLRREARERPAAPEVFLSPEFATELHVLREAEAAIAASALEVSTRLFVGNLPADTTEEEVHAAFAALGIGLESVTLPATATGMSRGFGFVDVADGHVAMKVLSAEGTVAIRSRTLRVDEANVPERRKSPQTRRVTAPLSDRMFIRNLPFETCPDDVRALFQGIGIAALDVYLLVDAASGKPKGCGFVSVATVDEAKRAIDALNGTTYKGRLIGIVPADPREEGGE
jgi:hypothetical protein